MRALKRTLGAVSATFAVLVSLVVLAPAAGAVTISSAGPLDEIILTDGDFNCQVAHVDDSVYEFFPSTDPLGACGTFVAFGGMVYGPASVPAGPTFDPFSTITTGPVTGTGSAADPYSVTTTATVSGLLTIEQTDTYVVGEQLYTTSVTLNNASDAPAPVVIYRAGDCYLNDSDFGFGATQAYPGGTAVACVGSDDGVTPNNRIEQWVPITPGSSYYEASYTEVWNAVNSGLDFPNTSADAMYQDNGAGLSWETTVPGLGSTTVEHQTQFVPSNVLAFDKTADAATSQVSTQNGYTVSVTNSTAEPQVLDSITDTLPAGFSYVVGSTTGETTADPTVSGQDLTWAGPFALNSGETIQFTFDVNVSATAGTYCNDVTGVSADATVLPALQVACIDVTAPPTTTLPVTPVTTAAVATTPSFTG